MQPHWHANLIPNRPNQNRPPLLEDRLEDIFERSDEQAQKNALATHKIFHLDGDHKKLTEYYPSIMLTAYVIQLIMNVVMVVYFRSLGHIGYNYWVTSVAMIAWQHFSNIVLFYAMFGSSVKWDRSQVRKSKPLYEFIFYEGWCGVYRREPQIISIFLGIILGPLCPFVFYIHWSKWEDTEGTGRIASIKRAIGAAINAVELADKRDEWLHSDLLFREGASQPQLFRYLTNPSVFLIIWNAPFAFFQFLIYCAAALNLNPALIGGVHVLAVFTSYTNVLLCVIFITPTPFWEWFFLSFFACSFDLVMIILTGLIHPHYRLMNAHMYNVSWFWTWSTMATSLWVPYWWMGRVKKRLVTAAHVGQTYAELQKYFTKLMGTFFTAVYTGLAQYRTFSWIVEFEFATNRMRFHPAGLIAKVIGWIQLPMTDSTVSRNHAGPISDMDLRLLIANLVLCFHLENQTDEESQATNMLIAEQIDYIDEIVRGASMDSGDTINCCRYTAERLPRARYVVDRKTNLTSIIRKRSREDVDQENDGSNAWMHTLKEMFLNVYMRGYVMTRFVCWAFFGYTLYSFAYALTAENMGNNLNNRDVIVIIFLLMQCLNLVGIIYYSWYSYRVWKLSGWLVSHVETVRVPVERGAIVLADMMQIYDDVACDLSATWVLPEFFVPDLAKLIRSFIPVVTSADYYNRFQNE